jgi:hypothetical protein
MLKVRKEKNNFEISGHCMQFETNVMQFNLGERFGDVVTTLSLCTLLKNKKLGGTQVWGNYKIKPHIIHVGNCKIFEGEKNTKVDNKHMFNIHIRNHQKNLIAEIGQNHGF